MPSQQRRAAGRRRAWGRGPIILRFEPLEGRQLLAADARCPTSSAPPSPRPTTLDWGDSFEARGRSSTRATRPTTGAVQRRDLRLDHPDHRHPGRSCSARSRSRPASRRARRPRSTRRFSLPPTPIPGYSASGADLHRPCGSTPRTRSPRRNEQQQPGGRPGLRHLAPSLITPQPAVAPGRQLARRLAASQTTWGRRSQ